MVEQNQAQKQTSRVSSIQRLSSLVSNQSLSNMQYEQADGGNDQAMTFLLKMYEDS